jgi:HK97 family phage portal protein
MGFWSRLLGREAKSNATLNLWRDVYGGRESNTGRVVNVQTALEVTTVLRCAGVIADGIATVPVKLFRKEPGGSRRAEAMEHPLHDVLTVAPNEWQDSLQFRETLAFHLVLTGNAFCFINRVRGRVVELLPIEPGKVSVKQGNDWSLAYEVTGLDGVRRSVPAESIWHIRGPSWNSWIGLESVKLAREAIGLALATEEAHARLHSNGVQPSGAWVVDGTLTRDQHKALTEWIKQNHAGLSHAGEPLVLDRAAAWKSAAMTGVDAQHVETRRLQIEEICRAFGVMPIMVGFSDKASTYASAEQMFLAHAVHTVRPWHRRFEAAIKRGLLTAAERAEGYYPKFLDAELMRGAAKDRGEFYARALGAGGSPAWMEINEVRGFEDMDEVDWGNGQPTAPATQQVPGTPAQPPPS